jgi:group I intron endonuclease
MLIYLVLRKGEVVYVGQTVQNFANRRGSHFSHARKGRGSILGSAIREFGASEFEFFKYLECQSLEELDFWESKLIAELNPRYNVQPGGKLGNFEPWNKGKKMSEEIREAYRKGAVNRKRTKRGSYSEEHKKKMSEGAKKKQQRPFECVQTGEIFLNKIDCAKKLNLNPSSLSVLLCRKSRLKTLKGLTFEYID